MAGSPHEVKRLGPDDDGDSDDRPALIDFLTNPRAR
jgi:hypothetical protein